MKRLAALALALTVAFPLCAQRGGGHGGISGGFHGGFATRSAPAFHSAPAFRSSFAASTPFRYAGSPLAARRYAYAPGSHLVSPLSRYAPTVSTVHPAFYQRNRAYPDGSPDRRHRFVPYRGAGVYAYPIAVGPAFWPYDDIGDYDDNEDYGNYNDLSAYAPEPEPPPDAEAGYLPPPPQPEPAPESEPEPPAPSATPQPAPEPAEAVTLIFKDNRPAEQVHNYLATRTTLTVIDGRRHYDIPIADLNLPATMKVNREAGVDFQLPSAQ